MHAHRLKAGLTALTLCLIVFEPTFEAKADTNSEKIPLALSAVRTNYYDRFGLGSSRTVGKASTWYETKATISIEGDAAIQIEANDPEPILYQLCQAAYDITRETFEPLTLTVRGRIAIDVGMSTLTCRAAKAPPAFKHDETYYTIVIWREDVRGDWYIAYHRVQHGPATTRP